MSIFKDDHRDARTLRAWLAGIFLRQRCRSYLRPPGTGVQHSCVLRRGHAGKHDNGLNLRWGYGDNWLEGD